MLIKSATDMCHMSVFGRPNFWTLHACSSRPSIHCCTPSKQSVCTNTVNNMFRRLFSSSARIASELVEASAQASRSVGSGAVDLALLPPAIQRHVRREVSKLPPSTVAHIPNPFVVQSFTKTVEGYVKR